MDRLKLVIPQKEHKMAVMDFREEFLKAKERISGGVGLEQAENYEDWLDHKYIPHYGLVDEAVFLAFDSVGNLVGISDIRLGTNDFIRTFAGRIGYSAKIYPKCSYRSRAVVGSYSDGLSEPGWLAGSSSNSPVRAHAHIC